MLWSGTERSEEPNASLRFCFELIGGPRKNFIAQTPFATDMSHSVPDEDLEDFKSVPMIPLGQLCFPVTPKYGKIAFSIYPGEKFDFTQYSLSDDLSVYRAEIRTRFEAEFGQDAVLVLGYCDGQHHDSEAVTQAWQRCVGKNRQTDQSPVFLCSEAWLAVVRDRDNRDIRLALYMQDPGLEIVGDWLWQQTDSFIESEYLKVRPLLSLRDTDDWNPSVSYRVSPFKAAELLLNLGGGIGSPKSEDVRSIGPEIQYLTGGGLDLLMRPLGTQLGNEFGPHFNVTFLDFASRFAPVPSESLAGAILRNLAYAEGLERLDVQLEAECRKHVEALDELLLSEDRRYREGIRRLDVS
jgi:hypothetical protein